ncbi:F-box/LRR-repeat protein 18-like [Mytilus trossulus]|uniref:F-box/LRR-repeat protein 18-like n=1 Tax=Mytilus trossulus TaxID=6551 RepID=UPI003005A05E
MDNFQILPDDIILLIFSHLSSGRLCILSKVSKRFQRLVQDRSLVRSSTFEECYNITDDMLLDYGANSYPHVECLNLANCYWFKSRSIEWVTSKCRQLTELYLVGINLTSKKICKILGSLPKLEKFSFTTQNIHEFDEEVNSVTEAQRTIGNLKHITIHFEVQESTRTDVAISVEIIHKISSFFEHCNRLESLHVLGQPNIGGRIPRLLVQPNVVKLENLKHLQHLSLNCAIDAAARMFYYGALFSIAKLKNLQLKTILNPSANFENQSQFCSSFWQSHRSLENLDLSNICLHKIFTEDCDVLEVKPHLQYLNLANTHVQGVNISLTSIASSCPNIHSLNLMSSKLMNKWTILGREEFDVNGFRALVRSCNQLSHINLSGIHVHCHNITSEICRCLSQLKGLTSLSLSPCCLHVEHHKESGAQKRPAEGPSHGSKKRRLAASTNVLQASTSSSGNSDSEEKWTKGLGLIVKGCPKVTKFELINGGLKQTVIQSGKSKPAPSEYKPCSESFMTADTLLCISGWKHLRFLQLAGIHSAISGVSLVVIAKECKHLQQLHLAYLGLTAHCMYISQLCQAFPYMEALKDFRLEHSYLSIDKTFCTSLSKCKTLERFCVVSKNGIIDSSAVEYLMEKVESLVVVQLFTDATQSLCKKLQKSLKDRYESVRPALSLAIWPLFDENAAYVMKNIPRKHLEEMTIFNSRICQQPPNFNW